MPLCHPERSCARLSIKCALATIAPSYMIYEQATPAPALDAAKALRCRSQTGFSISMTYHGSDTVSKRQFTRAACEI